MEYLIIVVLAATVAALFKLLQRTRAERDESQGELDLAVQKFGPVHQANLRLQDLEVKSGKVEKQLKAAKGELAQLERELAPLRETADSVAAGFYRPSYEFATSEGYQAELDKLRERLKAMVKDGSAVQVAEWTVDNNKKAGAKMSKDIGLMMLRAFNGECDATVAKVTYKNFGPSKSRIQSAFEALNKLGTVLKAELSAQYLSLRQRELQLVFEYVEMKYEEAAEQRAIRERMREEERVARALQKAMDDAEEDAAKWRRALDTAQQKLAKSVGEEKLVLATRVAALEAQLAQALEEKQRAQSMAEKTRAGYVYVISNIGSFGDGVYKVGMTRRLEPMDRVRELGDASVPFEFDVHALVYSEDAPRLENLLHKELAGHQVNRVNDRKEFFRVDLGTIERAVNKHHGRFSLTRAAEAREFRESMALSTSGEQKSVRTSEPERFQPTTFSRTTKAKIDAGEGPAPIRF